MRPVRYLLIGVLCWCCAACALVQSPAERAQDLAVTTGFARVEVPQLAASGSASASASPMVMPLRAYLRAPAPGRATAVPPLRLTIYIESDGAPWPAPAVPPHDPTPVKPLVLQMAIADPGAAVAYLGRPCQYLDAAALQDCDPALWTRGRFSEAAVAAVDRAVEALKAASGAREIGLVGYSGGGAMAALIAARRRDTVCLVSVASPLDTTAWTRAIGVSPLRTSHNPLDHVAALLDLPQTHFTGARDDVVPAATIARFTAPLKKARVISRASVDHDCCWARDWRELWGQSCLGTP